MHKLFRGDFGGKKLRVPKPGCFKPGCLRFLSSCSFLPKSTRSNFRGACEKVLLEGHPNRILGFSCPSSSIGRPGCRHLLRLLLLLLLLWLPVLLEISFGVERVHGRRGRRTARRLAASCMIKHQAWWKDKIYLPFCTVFYSIS